ncbi:MAG: DUF4832 domain-containing protein [Cytophagales bacterium]|nr:DUF4832 domain-containing protein [Cytophagales bacterium]
MKRLLLCLIAVSGVVEFGIAQTFTERTYVADESNFANPERGFYKHTETRSGTYSFLNQTTISNYRNQGISLILRVFYLDGFVETPISVAYLANMQQDFNTVRKAGLKVIVRFAYTTRSTPPYGDARPGRVLQHIEQLKPLLQQHSDVIAVVQAGFVGAWGEWYYTDHFAQSITSPTEADWANRRAVVLALTNALPSTRAVQMRTPNIKRKMVESTPPLTEAEALTGTFKARLGHHNDCFLASPSDVGTYGNVTEEKAYLEAETVYLPMGGETCGVYVPLSECPNALAEMQRFHWSYLNSDYHQTVLNSWKTAGCYDDTQKKLGYRYRLTRSKLPTTAKPNGGVQFSIALVNEGWANVFNPRKAEIILRNKTTGKTFKVATAEEPRKWTLADTIKINFTAGLPASIAPGVYEVLFSMPDPELTLSANPLYAIRMANSNVWEPATGYNFLQHELLVDATLAVPDYSGTVYFAATEKENSLAAPSPLLATASGTNVILYWGATPTQAHRVIERATGSGAYTSIAMVPPQAISIVDPLPTAGTPYHYRSYLVNETALSGLSESISIAGKPSVPSFYQYKVDSNVTEWEATQPLASNYTTTTTTFRLSTDRDSLYAYAEGNLSSWSIYLDLDNNMATGKTFSEWPGAGFDALIKDDSVFSFQSGWRFEKKIKTVAAGGNAELGVSLTDLPGLGSNLLIPVAFKATAATQQIDLPAAGEKPINFVRMMPPIMLASFAVNTSTVTPLSELIISWAACTACTGYWLERSTTPDAGFELLSVLPRATFIYYDKTVETDKVYYYRAAAYNSNGLSTYTPVVSGKASLVTGTKEKISKIFPNPAQEYLVVTKQPQQITRVRAVDLCGRKLELVRITETENEITYSLTPLARGNYILVVESTTGAEHHLLYKF